MRNIQVTAAYRMVPEEAAKIWCCFACSPLMTEDETAQRLPRKYRTVEEGVQIRRKSPERSGGLSTTKRGSYAEF